MQAMAKSAFQKDINGMRGLSVLMVVLYHFNLRIAGGGFIGVDIFFVISGYLMTKIIVSGMVAERFSYIDFVLRRATRIFPALVCLIAALLLAAYFWLAPSDLHTLSEQAVRALYFNSNNYFAAKQGYFDQGADDNWLLHTWSLSVEWQFYMLYPPIVWAFYALARRVAPARPHGVLAALMAATAAASLAYCVAIDSGAAFFSVMARSWQMLAGGLVYMALRARKGPPRHAALLSYGGCAVVLLSLVLVKRFSLEAVWPGVFALLPVLGGCMILLAAYEGNLLLDNVVVQKLGSWSYSIYLWHMPLVMALTMTGLLATQPRLSQVGGMALSLLLGYLSFRFIEPVRFLKQAGTLKSYMVLGAGGAATAAVAVLALQTGGFLFRVDQPQVYRDLRQAQQTATYDPTCENSGRARSRFCHVNAALPGKKILVMGDSHAGHLYAWFSAHSAVNTTFFVKSGCPLIEGYERVGTHQECAAFAKRAFELAGSGAYDTVIISQNWTGFGPGAAGICALGAGACVPVNQLPEPRAVLRSVERSLRGLLDKGVHVAVLDATPSFSTSAPKRIERELFWHGKFDAGADSAGFVAANRDYDALFRSFEGRPGFTLLSLRPQLCDGHRCLAYDSAARLSIYKDRDHFNPAWLVNNGAIFAQIAGRPAS